MIKTQRDGFVINECIFLKLRDNFMIRNGVHTI